MKLPLTSLITHSIIANRRIVSREKVSILNDVMNILAGNGSHFAPAVVEVCCNGEHMFVGITLTCHDEKAPA